MPDTTTIDPARIAQAIGDPSSIVRRIHTSFGNDRDESTTAWATRAVLAVLAEATPRPAGSPPQPEQTPGQVEIPAETHEAFQRALRRQWPAAGDWLAQYQVWVCKIATVAYAAGVVDGRQTGIEFGREIAGESIEHAAAARAIAGGWTPDPEDSITVGFAARIARGKPATEED
jgi:hypothetical protein